MIPNALAVRVARRHQAAVVLRGVASKTIRVDSLWTAVSGESRVGPGRSRVGCVRNATDRRPLLPPDVRISRIRRSGRIHRRAHAAC